MQSSSILSSMTDEGASAENPRNPTTSSPSSSSVEAAKTSFHFSEPLVENIRDADASETMMHTSSFFSQIEEETRDATVTAGDSEEAVEAKVTYEGDSKVPKAMDQTAAGEEEDCIGEQEKTAADKTTLADPIQLVKDQNSELKAHTQEIRTLTKCS